VSGLAGFAKDQACTSSQEKEKLRQRMKGRRGNARGKKPTKKQKRLSKGVSSKVATDGEGRTGRASIRPEEGGEK